MNIKRIIALLLTLALCLSMAACGKKAEEEPAEEITETEELETTSEGAIEAPEAAAEENAEEATEETEEGPQSFDVIMYGHALENVNIRNGAGKDFEKLDKVEAGSIVEIYEKQENVDGYTWYRIGEDMWVADDGTWFELCDSEIYTEGYFGVNPWDFTKELRAEWVLDQVKNEAAITPSTADSTFAWLISEVNSADASQAVYNVCYQGDYYGMVYDVECTLSKAGVLSTKVITDDRSNYDPANDYNFEAGADEPYVQTVYEGELALVLEAVKAHCEWYEPWFKGRFPNGLTVGHNCDWVIEAQPEGGWTGYLLEADLLGAADLYCFSVTLTEAGYVVEDTDGPYL